MPLERLVMPPHRVERFEGRPGGQEHTAAGQDLRREERRDRLVGRGRFEHAAIADLPAGLRARIGAEHFDAVRAQLRDVALRGRVLPHLPVHRRHDEQRAVARDAQSRQQIVGHAVRELGEEVGRRRRDHDRIGFARQINVRHVVRHASVPLARVDRPARQRLHRDGGDELRGRIGHDDLHGRACLGQQTREFGDLVAGDAARHAEDEVFACEFSGCQRKPPTKRDREAARGRCPSPSPRVSNRT
ncbi:hypothetical protein QFZ91_003729 [Paraburkholderia sp. JPY419]